MVNDMASIVTCFEARDGKLMWQGRLGEAQREGFRRRRWRWTARCTSRTTTARRSCCAAGPKFELLHVNSIWREHAGVAGAGGWPMVHPNGAAPHRNWSAR